MVNFDELLWARRGDVEMPSCVSCTPKSKIIQGFLISLAPIVYVLNGNLGYGQGIFGETDMVLLSFPFLDGLGIEDAGIPTSSQVSV